MTTECNGKLFEFHPLGRREVRADFSGGAITSDGGGLLLREVEKRTGIIARFAAVLSGSSRGGADRAPGGGVGGAAGVRVGAGIRGFERSRRAAAGSAAGGAGGEGRSHGREPGAGARSGQSAGGQEHAEPFRADEGGGGREGTLQEDRDGSSGGGPVAGRGVAGIVRASAGRDRSGFGCHGRSPVRAAGGAVLSWLLRGLLLSAAVYLLWGCAGVRALADLRSRGGGGVRGGVGADRAADSPGLAGGEDHSPGRLGILWGRADEVV